MRKIILFVALALFAIPCFAQPDTLGINLENYSYPYPVKFISLHAQDQDMRMAYMDIKPDSGANGRTVMLFHGKNFGGYYWKDVIKYLKTLGYRVVVPDQIGFGKSSKADMHYSFHQLARFNKQLLDSLGIKKISLLGHSMGGMLATRLTLMYPDVVEKLFLEDPIGLEDYRTFVPYRSVEEDYQTELKMTYESVQKYYQGSYFTQWKPDYDWLVKLGANVNKSADFPRYARAASLTYEMIYEQPVCYEFNLIKAPTVLFIGEDDNTIVGKALLSPAEQAAHGRYKILGALTARKIPNCKLVQFVNCKHIPHIEAQDEFLTALMENLR